MKRNLAYKNIDTIIQVVYTAFILSTSITTLGYFNLYQTDSVSLIIKYTRFTCYGLCVIIFLYNLITKKYSNNAMIVYSALYLLAITFYVISKDFVLLKTILLASIVYKKDYKELIIQPLAIQIIILFFAVACSRLGLIGNLVFLDGNRIRFFLGFSYVSFPNVFFLFTVLLYINHCKDNINYLHILLIEAINIYLYLMTRTKNPFFLVNVLLVVIIIIKTMPNIKNKTLNLRINKYIPFIVFAITLLLVYLPESSIRYSLNHLLSGRLDFARFGLEEYGISMLGSNVVFKGFSINDMSTEGYNFIDSSYINYLIRYGFVNLFAIMLIYVELLNKSIKEKDIYLYISAVTIIIFSMFEPFLYDLPFNIFPVIALSGYCSYEDNTILNRISGTLKRII